MISVHIWSLFEAPRDIFFFVLRLIHFCPKWKIKGTPHTIPVILLFMDILMTFTSEMVIVDACLLSCRI